MTEEQKQQQARQQINKITNAVLDLLEMYGITPHVGATVGTLVLIDCCMRQMADNPNDPNEDVDMEAVQLAATKWLHLVLEDMREAGTEQQEGLAS